MTEKISRDEQKRNKALDKAWDQIRYLDQRRKQFAMTLGTTGDSGRAQIESITTEMEDIASRSGFTLEQVLAGREAPTKDERAAAQVKLELSLLEKNYKDMSKAVAASPDPYARMHLEGTRQGIERSIFEFAEKNGLDKVEILARLREMTPEDLKKIGAEKIRQLAIERKQHELKVTMGDPDSREKYFEFEHRARKIVEEHGLPVSELTPFLAPEIPPDVEKELAEVSSSEAAAIKEEVRVAETTPADKRGFLKKLFGVGSKEARQQKKEEAEHAQIFEALGGYQAKYKEVTGYLKNESDQNSPLALELKSVLRNIEKGAYEAALRLPPGDRTLQNLGPFRSLLDANDKPRPSSFIDGKDEKFTPIPKESRYERFKHSLRKYFTIGIFAAFVKVY